ncbi:thioredoxin family protein [Croceiramulus getboli]|nr:thioredoxin family protein [Flavobacteriaceae bacterium YJPT1-3]
MKTTTQNTVLLTAQSVYKNAQTYPEYREEVAQLVIDQATTGAEQSEALINYTLLNDRRMKRWDKTLKFTAEEEQLIRQFNERVSAGVQAAQQWLVLTESWCGDASQSMPVMHAIAMRSPHINFRVSLRDQQPELMDLVLTRGARAIPKLIAFTQDELIGTWGARPRSGQQLIEDYKLQYGKAGPAAKEELQRWYNQDKGKQIKDELLALLSPEKEK